jgi:hypothetical protein
MHPRCYHVGLRGGLRSGRGRGRPSLVPIGASRAGFVRRGGSRSRAAPPRIPRIDPRNPRNTWLRAGAGWEFSGSSKVSSRNGLPPILATNAASGSTMVGRNNG